MSKTLGKIFHSMQFFHSEYINNEHGKISQRVKHSTKSVVPGNHSLAGYRKKLHKANNTNDHSEVPETKGCYILAALVVLS